MNFVEMLSKIGIENIEFQALGPSMTAGNVGKKGSTITFVTKSDYVGDLNKCLCVGGTPKKFGIVVWVDSEKWEAARNVETGPLEVIPDGQLVRVKVTRK